MVATDAPCRPTSFPRGVVRCVALGVRRKYGSINGNGSGDIFIAFRTANPRVDWGTAAARRCRRPRCSGWGLTGGSALHGHGGGATEEAIINAMLAAETMTGADYRRAWALPHDQAAAILAKYNWLQRR
ncbi:MAG: P1 family peptidase [Gemmatimonadetes bacterium]|nr:P1 family peptidase [Gemmatimonadota bacterium]